MPGAVGPSAGDAFHFPGRPYETSATPSKTGALDVACSRLGHRGGPRTGDCRGGAGTSVSHHCALVGTVLLSTPSTTRKASYARLLAFGRRAETHASPTRAQPQWAFLCDGGAGRCLADGTRHRFCRRNTASPIPDAGSRRAPDRGDGRTEQALDTAEMPPHAVSGRRQSRELIQQLVRLCANR